MIGIPQLPELISRFLYAQLNDQPEVPAEEVALDLCPLPPRHLSVFHSAVAIFYAPSDVSGIKGMKKERIRSVASWRGGPARRDCAFVVEDPECPGFQGLSVVRIHLFFSFKLSGGVTYPCALVSWFVPVGNEPCNETGMWIVEPQKDLHGNHVVSVIHLDCMLRAAHLIGVSGEHSLPVQLAHTDSLDAFMKFYVNKYADHHSHEIAF